ncbi:MAG: hypothetical protein ACE5F7_06990 [Nitrospiria bacterium]
MSGFNIPATKGGEIKKKRKIGRVRLERSLLNIFAMRVMGNFVEYWEDRDDPDANIAYPQELEMFLAGTLTKDVSYFFELNAETLKLEGAEDGLFEEHSGGDVALGRNFLVFNLGPLLREVTQSEDEKKAQSDGLSVTSDFFRIGPMMRIGVIDPSTFFSYPYERQFFKSIPGKVGDSGVIQRFTLAPSAFGAKFFGIRTTDGISVEATSSVLYHGEGLGIDVHALIGDFILQAGVMQGLHAGPRDVNANKDPYVMGRYNFGWDTYMSGSISAVVNWGIDTATVDKHLVDWLRYGVAGNIKLTHLDLYGAFVWDEIKGLPPSAQGLFEEKAYGMTVELDYLAMDKLMLMARYDGMNAGGFLNQKADGKVIHLQARYYLRDNLGIYIRDSYNIAGISDNPLQGFKNLVAIGVDFDW